jgi:hypothetical protein
MQEYKAYAEYNFEGKKKKEKVYAWKREYLDSQEIYFDYYIWATFN